MESLSDVLRGLVFTHHCPQLAEIDQSGDWNARLIRFDPDSEDLGAPASITLCIDHRVHLYVSHSWQGDDTTDKHKHAAFVRPCDCQQYEPIALEEPLSDLVSQFLQDGQPRKLIWLADICRLSELNSDEYLRQINGRNRKGRR